MAAIWCGGALLAQAAEALRPAVTRGTVKAAVQRPATFPHRIWAACDFEGRTPDYAWFGPAETNNIPKYPGNRTALGVSARPYQKTSAVMTGINERQTKHSINSAKGGEMCGDFVRAGIRCCPAFGRPIASAQLDDCLWRLQCRPHTHTNLALKMRSALLIALATASCFVTALAAENPAVPNDLAQLQGTWSMVSGTADGQAMPDFILGQAQRVCKGDEITVTVGGQLIMKAKITIDPSKKPRTIEFQVIDGPTTGKRQLGIYEVDGDTLKSCFAAPDAERPNDFTSKSGDMHTSTVWKREKEAAPKSK